MTGRKQGELQSPSFKKAKKEDPGNHKQVSLNLIPRERKKTLSITVRAVYILHRGVAESPSLEILN